MTSPLVDQFKSHFSGSTTTPPTTCPFSKLYTNNNTEKSAPLTTTHHKSSQCPSTSRQSSTCSDSSSMTSPAAGDTLPFVVYLMSHEDMTMQEISALLVEVMMGGIDTVSEAHIVLTKVA